MEEQNISFVKYNQKEIECQKLQEEIKELNKRLAEARLSIDIQNGQLSHRSVKIALKIEKKIDKINKFLRLGKYSKKGSTSNITEEEVPMSQISYDSWYEDDEDFSQYKTDIKAIAFYLPQFHEFKENNEWWGKGFTEWTNTKKSQPRFVSHYQPREPHNDIGYYDLSDWKVLRKQAELAKQHGIYGFCFYRYWFAGKTLMEKPLDLFLEHPEIDINFCLCWANENWTRKWDGNNSEILIGQNYSNNSVDYIKDIKKYILDPRYIRVDGKPVIIIYRPNLLPDATKTFKHWRKVARECGIGEILIWIQRGAANFGQSAFCEGADAEIEFPPSGTAEFDNYSITRVGAKPEDGNLIGYKKIVNNITNGKGTVEKFKHKVYRGITLGWDNSPRRRTGFWAIWGFSLYDYHRWLEYIIEYTRRNRKENDRFIFINAWNEWAEGTYLEPDRRFGYSSINVTSRALFDLPFSAHIDGNQWNLFDKTEQIKANNLISRNIPLFPFSLYNMYHSERLMPPYEAWDECNKLPNPSEELKQLRERFIEDEKKSLNTLKLKRVFFEDLPEGNIKDIKRTVAVHIHLFYIDMIPFMKKYLINIPTKFDLLLSIPETVECDITKVQISFKEIQNIDNVFVKICPNRGRDIAPLICLFGKDLVKYDFVAHLHSKKSLHTATHNTWAEFIFSHLLGSKDNVTKIFNMLNNNVGMVAPPDYLLMPEQPSGWGSNKRISQEIINKSELDINLKELLPVIEFPQGSMFWAQSKFIKHLLQYPISFADFPEEPIGTDGTIAHAFERLFYVWGIETGLETRQVFTKNEEELYTLYR